MVILFKPEEIAVEKAEVDSQGNIVLTLANEGVLNYTAPSSRNLPMIMHYAIAPMTLAFVEEENPAPVTPSKEKQQTLDTKKTPAKAQTVKPKAQAKTKTKVVKSGDSTTILPYVGIAVDPASYKEKEKSIRKKRILSFDRIPFYFKYLFFD
nr:hypothetical protein [uncultured Sharpea sp.]